MADRDKAGPHGLFGGQPGSISVYALMRDGEETHLSSKSTVHLRPGDVISYRTSGGGGYEDPFLRDPELVLSDVADGKVSVERASSVYGVVISGDGRSVDVAATERLRGGSDPDPAS